MQIRIANRQNFDFIPFIEFLHPNCICKSLLNGVPYHFSALMDYAESDLHFPQGEAI